MAFINILSYLDFPLCKLSKSCQEVLISSMKKCSEQTLEHLFYHCLQTMISEAQKGEFRVLVLHLLLQARCMCMSMYNDVVGMVSSFFRSCDVLTVLFMSIMEKANFQLKQLHGILMLFSFLEINLFAYQGNFWHDDNKVANVMTSVIMV